MDDRHVVPIPPEVLAQAQAHIDAALRVLALYLLPLTPEERHDMAKMGPNRKNPRSGYLYRYCERGFYVPPHVIPRSGREIPRFL
jgi:hypothetical protein